MPRLFSGLEIPGGIGARLAMLREELPGVRWIEPEDFHITLRFFGEVDHHTADELVMNLARISPQALTLQLQGIGLFGGESARALWVGLRPEPALSELQRKHERAARQSGLPPDGRKFTAHVTIARLRGTHPGALARYLGVHGGFVSPPFPVTRFALFSSRPGSGGGPYVVEEVFPLGGGGYEDYEDYEDSSAARD